MTDRQLAERMAEALAECEGMLDRGTYGDAKRLIPMVRKALAAFRESRKYPCPQRDGEGEMKAGECENCKGTGKGEA